MRENNNLFLTKYFCTKFVSKEESVSYTIYIFIAILVMGLNSYQFKLRILQHVGLRTENLTLLRISFERKLRYDDSIIDKHQYMHFTFNNILV